MLSLFSVMLTLQWTDDFLSGLKILVVKSFTMWYCIYQDCEASSICCIKNNVVPDGVNQLNHMRPVVLETPNLAQ